MGVVQVVAVLDQRTDQLGDERPIHESFCHTGHEVALVQEQSILGGSVSEVFFGSLLVELGKEQGWIGTLDILRLLCFTLSGQQKRHDFLLAVAQEVTVSQYLDEVLGIADLRQSLILDALIRLDYR